MQSLTRTDERFLTSDVFDRDRPVARPDHGQWSEPAKDVPVYHRCGVLVVGGGPSGTAAAAAAAAAGADVALLERYNHLGGLSTGGLVIWIDRMTDWEGKLVVRGFAEELFDRLPKEAIAGPERKDWGSQDPAKSEFWSHRTASFHGVVTWSPTIDPERLKLLSQEMVIERGVKLIYHSWACVPIVQEEVVRGVIFESKEGRMAIMADVVVDATGDGDLFARAGAAFVNDIELADVHHCMNTSWLFGGVDMRRWIDFKTGNPEAHAALLLHGREALKLFERPFVSWRNDIALFMGPRQAGYSALDVDDLTAVEVRSRRAMAAHLEFFKRHAPGFEEAHLLQSAPQVGVRHARRLVGADGVWRERWPDGTPLYDEIAVSPAVSPKFPNISVPFGALLPQELNGLLACGRHISCDRNSHGFMREIPQCWLTGQAAGVGAALAANGGIAARTVAISAIQAELLRQGVYLRPGAERRGSSESSGTVAV